ncbi:MAG: hypothetical protein KDC28_05435 [Saprospiraceae bacterium]|nr:hypothetical protein [Saprospiraceae bacterium]MCB9320855.1 hypothetical protein [Lewinellaceae bacterium]
MQRKAVIDLGTNTFHLLIVEQDGTILRTLVKVRDYVKLGADGIHKLSEAAMERGIRTLAGFAQQLEDYEVEDYRAIGTAALRTATNTPVFLDRVRQATGLRIDVISPDREAELISKGIRMDVPLDDMPSSMMLDIGGGSVECIFHTHDDLVEAVSFPVGVAVLHRLFHHSDPLSAAEEYQMRTYLDPFFQPLIARFRDTRPVMIGASGSFEVLDDYFPIPSPWGAEEVLKICREITAMNQEARAAHPAIPSERVGYIVMACVLIAYLIEHFDIPEVWYTPFALKEGILSEWYPGHQLVA